jgi:hypothetical protein
MKTETVKNKDIKSFSQLPLYVLDLFRLYDNTYRQSKFKYGIETINCINPNDNKRWIYEVEFLCNNKTLENSRMLWCVVERENETLHPMGLGKDII